MKKTYDTSSLIDIWDYYLPSCGLFPEFWAWLLPLFKTGEAIIPAVAFEELEAGAGDFAKFLLAEGVEPVKEDMRVKEARKAIQEVLGTGPKGFPAPGVGEADITILATAKALQMAVVTEEEQDDMPKNKARSKMPSACKMLNMKCLTIKGVLAERAATLAR